MMWEIAKGVIIAAIALGSITRGFKFMVGDRADFKFGLIMMLSGLAS